MLLVSAFVTTGCAYRWGVPERILPGRHHKVSIPIFKNTTPEPVIEVFFTNALLAEFERSSVGQIVEDRLAEARIVGTILKVEFLPAGPREGGDLPTGAVLASEYRILLNTQVDMIRKSDDQVIWSTTVSGERTYVAPQVTQGVVNTVNPIYNQSARRINIEILSKQMMSEAFARLTESF